MKAAWHDWIITQKPPTEPQLSDTCPQLIDLSNELGVIHCEGEASKQFFQGQLAADIDKIAVNQYQYSVMATIKGRVLALPLVIHARQDEWYLILPVSLIKTVGKLLRNIGRLSRVTVSNASDQSCLFAIIGADSTEQIKTRYNLSEIKIGEQLLTDHGYLLPLPHTQPGFLLMPRTLDQAKDLWQHCNTACQLATTEDWHRYLIKNRFPLIQSNNSEKYLVHPLGLDKTEMVSLSKGCFVGQEIIARTTYRGKVSKHAYLFQVACPVPPVVTQALFPNESRGEVVSLAKFNQDNYIILAIVADNAIDSLFLDEANQYPLRLL